MLETSGGCFSVRLIRELDVFSVFVSFFGGASYTRKYTVYIYIYIYIYIIIYLYIQRDEK